jgi:hypothetical protein
MKIVEIAHATPEANHVGAPEGSPPAKLEAHL